MMLHSDTTFPSAFYFGIERQRARRNWRHQAISWVSGISDGIMGIACRNKIIGMECDVKHGRQYANERDNINYIPHGPDP